MNAFGISESDTRILWASIRTAKLKSATPGAAVAKKQKSTQEIERKQISVPFLRDSFFTESFFEISKYDIKT